MRYFDDVSQKAVLDAIVEAGVFLLGRKTYEIFAGYWPNAPEEEQVIAVPLNTKQKYVVSTTLGDPLDWENSTVLLLGGGKRIFGDDGALKPLRLAEGQITSTGAILATYTKE